MPSAKIQTEYKYLFFKYISIRKKYKIILLGISLEKTHLFLLKINRKLHNISSRNSFWTSTFSKPWNFSDTYLEVKTILIMSFYHLSQLILWRSEIKVVFHVCCTVTNSTLIYNSKIIQSCYRTYHLTQFAIANDILCLILSSKEKSYCESIWDQLAIV